MSISVLIALVAVQYANTYEPWNFNGTTPSLKAIFLGRCGQYQELNVANRLPSLFENVNCSEMWELFTKAFKSKTQCVSNITEQSYEDYFSKFNSSRKLVNQAMFWSGTRVIVHDFTYVNHNFYTLEDTFAGYVANDLKWCGCSKCVSGFDMDYCNTSRSCCQVKPYFDRASRKFAESAAGEAYVMLNSTPKKGDTAYFNGSVFGRIELPTLGNQGCVKHLTILLVADVDKKPKEQCEKGSVRQLVRDAAKYKLSTSCIENPSMVASLLCAKYPNAEQCKNTNAEPQNVSGKWKEIGVAFTVIACVLFVLVTILVLKIIRSRKAAKSPK